MSNPSSESTQIRREWSMPNRWTFRIQPIRDLVTIYAERGEWIDPFAGESDIADITNDINPSRDTDYNLDATEFMSQFDDDSITGGIILDPPYSATQVKRLYDDIGVPVEQNDCNASFYGRPKDQAQRILEPGAKLITLGWNSVGGGKSRDFEKDEILLVCHGSSKNDTIVTVETYRPPPTTTPVLAD